MGRACDRRPQVFAVSGASEMLSRGIGDGGVVGGGGGEGLFGETPAGWRG